ncbi:MAG: inositol monophosphatase family protein [Acidimicrobiia bacterium]
MTITSSSEQPPVSKELLSLALELVKEAGELTLKYFRSTDLEVVTKQDGTPVTIADQGAEALIRARLGELRPNDTVVGEEDGLREGSSGHRWIIDPIDGTKAFTHGVPLYSNLLALEDEHGPAIGVINLPALGETVWAGRGRGCFCNDEPATVSTTNQVSEAWLMTSGLTNWPAPLFNTLKQSGIHVRTWGDGYGYALVATGRADVMLDPEVSLWDVAPMPVILSEAGGRFSSTNGREGAHNGSGLATNGVLHDELIKLLSPTGIH